MRAAPCPGRRGRPYRLVMKADEGLDLPVRSGIPPLIKRDINCRVPLPNQFSTSPPWETLGPGILPRGPLVPSRVPHRTNANANANAKAVCWVNTVWRIDAVV